MPLKIKWRLGATPKAYELKAFFHQSSENARPLIKITIWRKRGGAAKERRLNWTLKNWARSILSVCLFSNLSDFDIFCHFGHYVAF